jgi:hypothetical protein
MCRTPTVRYLCGLLDAIDLTAGGGDGEEPPDDHVARQVVGQGSCRGTLLGAPKGQPSIGGVSKLGTSAKLAISASVSG